MPGVRFRDLPRALSDAGEVLPGASLAFYESGTADPQAVYADGELDVLLPNPLVADGAGRFRQFWLDTEIEYGATLTDSDGNLVWEQDPVGPFPNTDPVIPLNDSGQIMPVATLTYWRSGTTELAEIFEDEELTIPADNPLSADGVGEFSTVYLDDEDDYRVRLENSDGVLVWDVDPFQAFADPPPPPILMIAGDEDGFIGYSAGFIGQISGDINIQLPTAQVLTLRRTLHLFFFTDQIQVRILGATSTPATDVFSSLSFLDKDGTPRVLMSADAAITTPALRERQWQWANQGSYFVLDGEYELTFTP